LATPWDGGGSIHNPANHNFKTNLPRAGIRYRRRERRAQRRIAHEEEDVRAYKAQHNLQQHPAPPRKRGHNAQTKLVASYAQMLLDPCSATLVPGLYGSDQGMLARNKQSRKFDYTLSGFAGATSGYIMWCPDYTNVHTGAPFNMNCFQFATTDSSTRPLNTASDPFGMQSATGTAVARTDPAGAFLTTDLVADYRPIGGCVTFEYVGSLKESAGQITYIHNIPAATVLNGGAGGTPLSVDEIFAYSAGPTSRLGLETYENIFRPTEENSTHFRSEDDALFLVNSGTETVLSENARNFSPQMIGFAWRGAPPEAPIVIELTKNGEWRPEASAGLGQASGQTTPSSALGSGVLPIATRVAERASGGRSPWFRTMGQGLLAQARHAWNDATGGLMAAANGKLLTFAQKEMAALSQSAVPLLLSSLAM